MIIYQLYIEPTTFNDNNTTQPSSQFSDSTFPEEVVVNDVGGDEEGSGEDLGACVELQPGGGVVQRHWSIGQKGEA